jgi:hypothetical protein
MQAEHQLTLLLQSLEGGHLFHTTVDGVFAGRIWDD